MFLNRLYVYYLLLLLLYYVTKWVWIEIKKTNSPVYCGHNQLQKINFKTLL